MVFRESDSGGEGRGCALVANATLCSFSNIFQCIVGWLHECENLGYGQWLIEILDVKDRNKRGRERRRASRSKLVWFFVCVFLKGQLQRVSILRRSPLVYVGLSQLAHFAGIFINRVPFSSTISLVELCMLQSTLSGRARGERKQAVVRERKAGLLGKVSETERISKVGRGGDLGGRGEGSLWTTTCKGGCQWPSTCSRSPQSLT